MENILIDCGEVWKDQHNIYETNHKGSSAAIVRHGKLPRRILA